MFHSSPPARCFVDGPGGLGIPLLAAEMHMLRLNGWSRAKATIDEFFPELRRLTYFTVASTHPVHAEVVRAWHALPPTVSSGDGVLPPFADPAAPTTAPPPFTDKAAVVAAQRKLSEAFTNWRRGQIRARLTPQGRLLWERAAGKGAKEWLDMAPLYPSRRLTSEQARVATLLWLHRAIAELGTELGTADPAGRSLLRADRAGRIHRHGGVVIPYADMFVEAGYQVWTEAQILPEFDDSMSAAARGGVASGSARRMGVAAVPPDTSLTAHAADPSVLDGAAPEFPEAWCRSVVVPCPLEAAENVKRVHYGDLAPRWSFSVPMVRRGTWGRARTPA